MHGFSSRFRSELKKSGIPYLFTCPDFSVRRSFLRNCCKPIKYPENLVVEFADHQIYFYQPQQGEENA